MLLVPNCDIEKCQNRFEKWAVNNAIYFEKIVMNKQSFSKSVDVFERTLSVRVEVLASQEARVDDLCLLRRHLQMRTEWVFQNHKLLLFLATGESEEPQVSVFNILVRGCDKRFAVCLVQLLVWETAQKQGSRRVAAELHFVNLGRGMSSCSQIFKPTILPEDIAQNRIPISRFAISFLL